MPRLKLFPYLVTALISGLIGYGLRPAQVTSTLESQEVAALSKRLNEAQAREANLKKRVTELEGAASRHESGSGAASVAAAAVNSPRTPAHLPAANRRVMRSFFVEHELAEIEKYSALSDEERDALQRKFNSMMENQGKLLPSERSINALDAEQNSILKDVLGDERAQEIVKQQEAAERRELDDALDQATLTFSRKLSLTSEQERATRAALSNVLEITKPMRETLQLKMQEVGLQHQTNDPEALKSAIDEMRDSQAALRTAKRTLLQEKLSGVLGQDQVQALSDEIQANPDSLFGIRGY